MKLVGGSVISLIILFGGFLVLKGAENAQKAYESERWPEVEGVVADASTNVSRSRDSETDEVSLMYSAKLVFAYVLQGKEFTTENVAFGETMGSGDSSEAAVWKFRYPVGKRVRVRYEPGNPENAVVKPGMTTSLFWLPGAGLIVAFMGAMFLILFLSEGEAMGAGMRLFVVVFWLFGLPMLGMGAWRLWHAHASQNWPQAQGEIVYGQQDGQASVGTNLVFRYEAGGETRFSNIRRFGSLAASSQDWADEVAERYPMGKAVTVFVNPSDADQGVLEPGISQEAFYLPGAGLAFILFGLLVWFVGIPALTQPIATAGKRKLKRTARA
jgi:hypothetical protein